MDEATEFKRFMEEENLWEAWKNNYYKDHVRLEGTLEFFFKRTTPCNYVNEAFLWSSTKEDKERSGFWHDVEVMWELELDILIKDK